MMTSRSIDSTGSGRRHHHGVSPRIVLLPVLAVLYAAKERGLPLSGLFDRLPKRYSRAALLKQFPRPVSLKIVERYSPGDARISEAVFVPQGVLLLDSVGGLLQGLDGEIQTLQNIVTELADFFSPALGFGEITRINYVDGVRLYFSNGDIAHLRPSGNADELRIYAVADSQVRADAIAKLAVAEPDGILRRLENRVI